MIVKLCIGIMVASAAIVVIVPFPHKIHTISTTVWKLFLVGLLVSMPCYRIWDANQSKYTEVVAPYQHEESTIGVATDNLNYKVNLQGLSLYNFVLNQYKPDDRFRILSAANQGFMKLEFYAVDSDVSLPALDDVWSSGLGYTVYWSKEDLVLQVQFKKSGVVDIHYMWLNAELAQPAIGCIVGVFHTDTFNVLSAMDVGGSYRHTKQNESYKWIAADNTVGIVGLHVGVPIKCIDGYKAAKQNVQKFDLGIVDPQDGMEIRLSGHAKTADDLAGSALDKAQFTNRGACLYSGPLCVATMWFRKLVAAANSYCKNFVVAFFAVQFTVWFVGFVLLGRRSEELSDTIDCVQSVDVLGTGSVSRFVPWIYSLWILIQCVVFCRISLVPEFIHQCVWGLGDVSKSLNGVPLLPAFLGTYFRVNVLQVAFLSVVFATPYTKVFERLVCLQNKWICWLVCLLVLLLPLVCVVPVITWLQLIFVWCLHNQIARYVSSVLQYK